MQVLLDTAIDPVRWDRLHAGASAALQQDRAYGDALASLGVRCTRAMVLADGEPAGLAQFLVRPFGGLVPVALCSHGPVWTERLDAAGRGAALRAVRRALRLGPLRVVLFTPDASQPAGAGVATLRRVMTGASTVRLDLGRPLEALRASMHGKWRNRLAAAERSALRVVRLGTQPAQYRWLLERELAQRGARGYIALPDGFVECWQAACRAAPARAGEPLLTLRADLGREAVAGMMFVVHGTAATYHVGWSTEAGRDAGAHNLLLWHGIRELRERGVRLLDLGGVDTGRGAGIARFKIGTGGAVTTFAGTYL
jgi:hypothetical protein